MNRLLEFLDTFCKKDVADDEQLRLLVEEVRGLLNGQDASRQRKDQRLRAGAGAHAEREGGA